MTNKELIELLQEHHLDEEVVFSENGRYYTVDTIEYDGDHSVLLISLDEDSSSDNLDDLLENL